MSNLASGTDGFPNDPVAQPEAQPEPRWNRPKNEKSSLARALWLHGLSLFFVTAYALIVIRGTELPIRLFRSQDVLVLGVAAALLLAISTRPGLLRHVPSVRVPKVAPALMIAFVLLVAAGGTWLVFGNYDESRDEFMANLDAHVFASGRLVWPIPMEWRPFSHALMPLFVREGVIQAGWISDYLPGNAVLRAIAQRTIGREFTSPILAAVSAFALYRISVKLWPETPRSALIPLLLLTMSPQFLVMAMTPFAMTAHLAFNLLWLLCFLQNNRRGDAGALACGFVATGLHQLVFHPVFAAPFVLELVLARRFRRAGLFIAGYASISAFWVLYPQMLQSLVGAGHPSSDSGGVHAGLAHLAGTVSMLLGTFSVANFPLTLLNLLRFAAWQHLLLLPLVFCAWPAIRRAQGIARPLLVGAALMLALTFLVIPFQGNGWGYRYIHGFLGSFCLLAGYGWQRLAAFGDERRATLALTTAATATLILPFQMVSTHAIVAPWRAASAFIQASPGDVVLVDGSGMQFAMDLVLNDVASFDRRPKVMFLQYIKERDLRDLCKHYDVRLFDRRHGSQFGIPLANLPDYPSARAILPSIGCDNPMPLSAGIGVERVR